MVGLQTLDLAIGVRVPASQPTKSPPLRFWLSFIAPLADLVKSVYLNGR